MNDATLLARDAEARALALSPDRSFIVRAPAGSGKTELLIQRVLALLATVDAPEEVVAMTFTRKAAAEMQLRVLKALAAARGPRPTKAHEQRTHDLACAALQRDGERGWDLADNPARLRILTIDALAQALARQLPMTLGLGAAPNVAEQPAELYDAAARATLAHVDGGADAALTGHVARLLAYLDNDVEYARSLLVSMLARRDQWLRHLHADRARDTLEAFLRAACERQLQRVTDLIPPGHVDELLALARYAAAQPTPDSTLAACRDLTGLPTADDAGRAGWCALAELLLTGTGTWRQRYTKDQGFPPAASKAEKEQADAYKRRIVQLVAELGAHEPLRAALDGVRRLPPVRYSDAQWEMVQTIVAVLKQAAAELLVVFAEAGRMDFPEVTRRAVLALDGGGTDLAVALDARIRHVLIDEFQDTSISQYMLLACLTAGWSAGDGRTLFVVGDPMQSIYRFREAEVGLFLRAWERGLEGLPLEPLQLTRNFRSQAGLVQWCNGAFGRVLAARSDIPTGAVAFEPAAAEREAAGGPAVAVHALIEATEQEEAARVVELVRAVRASSPTATIALLVRARSHLAQIARELIAQGLRPTAVDLDPLALRPVVADLLALTRALDHGADRVAWLAVLRAPWCGLTLADLAALCEGQGDWNGRTLLDDASALARVSPDGRERLERLAAVVRQADALHDRTPMSERVEHAWILLGGPACLPRPEQRAEAARYFEHLARHEEDRGGVLDTAVLETSLQQLYAAPDADADPAFHVMTIHKAKGLEFDHVLVPGLARPPKGDDPRLLLWMEREADAGSELLLAPVRAKGSGEDPLLDWLRSELAERQRHEDERLVYVAATRAKERLHWLACVKRNAKGEPVVPSASLLARLWPAVAEHFPPGERGSTAAASAQAAALDQTLRRLPAGWRLPALPASVAWAAAAAPRDPGAAIEFSWAGETARRVGVVVHRWLQRMAEDALVGWDADRVHLIAPKIERALAAGGLTGDALADAGRRAAHALTNAVTDARGRWVLGPHAEQRSEWRLTVAQGSAIRRVVLDRTFVTEAGVRWIVDYKVGAHEGADVAGFLDAEQDRYRGQLETYAKALDPRAQLGLYFPLVPGWREWQPPPAQPEANDAGTFAPR